MLAIDAVNAQSLELLQDDGRMTNARPAEHLNMIKPRQPSFNASSKRPPPNILACHNTTGADDFLLLVVARDLDDYSAFVDSTLRRLPGVTSIRSNLSLKEIRASSKLPVRVSLS